MQHIHTMRRQEKMLAPHREKNEVGLFGPTPCCVIRIVTAAIFLFLRHESLRVAERQDTNNLHQNTAKA